MSVLSGYQVLIVFPMVYYAYLSVKNKQVKLPVSAWFLLAFAAVALLSLIINFDIIPKPSKNFGRVQYFFYGVGGIFAFRAWLASASEKARKYILWAFYLNVTVAAAYAIKSFDFGVPGARAKGLTETMRYGYGSAMAMMLLLGCILHHDKLKNWFNWKIAVPILVLGLFGMYLTYTRGALLGFLCGLPFMIYFYKPKLGLAMAALALIAVSTLGAFYFFGSGSSGSRFLMSKGNESDKIRMSQWKSAIYATKEKPVFGWGLSNFHTQLKRIKVQYDLDAKDYNDAHSHNLFLEIASGTGLVGLALFFGWIISWAIESFKAGGLIRALIVPFGIVFVVSSQFEVTFDANNATMIFFLYALSSAALIKRSPW